MQYHLKAFVTIDPKRPNSPSVQSLLVKRGEGMMKVLEPIGVQCKTHFSYYHPDEEYELADTDFVTLVMELACHCKKFRSLVLVAQIIQSLTALFDGTFGIAYHCRIADPNPVPPDDENV